MDAVRRRHPELLRHVEDVRSGGQRLVGQAQCHLTRLAGHLHQALHGRLDLRADGHLCLAQVQRHVVDAALVHAQAAAREHVQLIKNRQYVGVQYLADGEDDGDGVDATQRLKQYNKLQRGKQEFGKVMHTTFLIFTKPTKK